VISDLNQSYGSTSYGSAVHAAVEALSTRRPPLVLITGDMVAGQKRGVDAPAMWRAFRRAVRDPLAKAGVTLAPTPGNHDAAPGFDAERAEYVREWGRPDERLTLLDASAYPLRYSFTFRGAFFLSLDAARIGPISAEQRAWVEQQLVAAASYRPKIVFGHVPLYPIAHGREKEILYDDDLEHLFARHGVDLYVSGHHHAYYPGRSPSLRHLAMPCLGGGARPLIGTRGASAQALALLEIDDGELTSIEAYAAPRFEQPIARTRLPRKITLGRRTLTRDDVVEPAAAASARVAGR
jgi:3',5'-cyclic AMP phosphodiesterase CpdA